MNQNEFYFENIHRTTLARQTTHHALPLRTRATASYDNCEIVTSSLPAKPVLTVKHIPESLKDPINGISKHLLDTEREDTALRTQLKKVIASKRIFNEQKVIDENTKKFIERKLLKKTPYITDREFYDLNFNRGTLDLIEGGAYSSFAHVWNGKSIQFNRLEENVFKQLHSTASQATPVPNQLLIKRDSEFIAACYKDYVDIARAPPDYNDLPKMLTIEPFDKHKENRDIVACSLTHKYVTTINTKHWLHRYDIEHKYCPVKVKLSDYFVGEITPVSLQDNMKAANRHNNITLTTRHHFCLIDCRTRKRNAMTKLFTNEDHMAFKCEKIMSHANSLTDTNVVFIGSSHMLYAFDYRKLKEPVVHWAHHLIKPAFLLKTEMYGTDEIICLSSHRNGDFALFNYSPNQINYDPFKPLTLNSTLNDLRKQGLFLLSDNIIERMSASTTGIALKPDPMHRKVKVYVQNYYGDVFEHAFKCRNFDEKVEDQSNQNWTERYHEWERFLSTPRNANKEICTKERVLNPTMAVHDIVRLGGLSKILTGEKVPTTEMRQLEPEQNTVPKASWEINLHDAGQYKDLLAAEIMQVWDDMEIEEIRPAMFAQALDTTTSEREKGLDKVSLWLQNAPSQQSMINDSMEFEDCSMFIDGPSTSTAAAAAATGTAGKMISSTPARKKPRLAGF